MAQWFRLYETVLDDPKAQRLSDQQFRIWVNLLCVSSRFTGKIPADTKDLAFLLRIDESDVINALDNLIRVGLIDKIKQGYQPHNWNKRQYKSDVSTERVKQFRKRFRNKIETPPEAEAEADTESETEKKKVTPLAVARVVASLPDWVPLDAWKGFVEMRTKIRAPLTERAKTLALEKLDALRCSGENVEAVLNQSVEKSWRGLFAIKTGESHDASNTKRTATDKHLDGIASLIADIRSG